MSRFSISVIQDVNKNFENINTSYFNKNDTEYPQHILENIQDFIPIYTKIFDVSKNAYKSMSLNHRYHVINGTDIYDTQTKESTASDFFVKYSPCLLYTSDAADDC